MVRIDYQVGPKSLPAFTPKGEKLYVTFSCLGPGKLALGTLFTMSPCDGTSTTTALRGQTDKRQTLTLDTDMSTQWRLLITSGS